MVAIVVYAILLALCLQGVAEWRRIEAEQEAPDLPLADALA